MIAAFKYYTTRVISPALSLDARHALHGKIVGITQALGNYQLDI